MTHDVDISFNFLEIHTKAKILGIIYHKILVKAYWLIQKIEKYYTSICQACDII